MTWTDFSKFMEPLLIPAVVFIVISGVTLLIRNILFKFLHRWAERTQTDLDDIVIGAVRLPSFFWCLILGIYVGVGASNLSPRLMGYSNKILAVLIIVSMALAAANILARVFIAYARRSAVEIPATGLTQGLIKLVVLVIGFTILLGSLGVSITPVVTALGVGGIAVALALQSSLSNLVSGIHILLEKPVRVGDYVKLEGGEEGYVEDIGWRTTRIRKLQNNMVIIPNSKLVESIITNFYLPEKEMALLIEIGVSYDSDPDHVERVLIEEAKEAAKYVPGLLAEPEPFVRFIPGFQDFSLNFTLICRVREFVDQYLAQHEIRKRLFKRFKREGIEIPFPIRTVYLADGRQSQLEGFKGINRKEGAS